MCNRERVPMVRRIRGWLMPRQIMSGNRGIVVIPPRRPRLLEERHRLFGHAVPFHTRRAEGNHRVCGIDCHDGRSPRARAVVKQSLAPLLAARQREELEPSRKTGVVAPVARVGNRLLSRGSGRTADLRSRCNGVATAVVLHQSGRDMTAPTARTSSVSTCLTPFAVSRSPCALGDYLRTMHSRQRKWRILIVKQ